MKEGDRMARPSRRAVRAYPCWRIAPSERPFSQRPDPCLGLDGGVPRCALARRCFKQPGNLPASDAKVAQLGFAHGHQLAAVLLLAVPCSCRGHDAAEGGGYERQHEVLLGLIPANLLAPRAIVEVENSELFYQLY